MTTEPYVEAGARAILRRALFEVDVEVGSHFPTDRLVALVHNCDAPVGKVADWWDIMAEGKPNLTDRQRALMVLAGRRALELCRAGDPR